jgi:hypothetical protein
MKNFQSFQGIITMIDDFQIKENDEDIGCYKLMSVVDGNGAIVNFVVAPDTYFVNHEMVGIGDMVTGFYDANIPVPMIYPPRYQAIVMAINSQYQNVKVDYFNDQLISSDNQLRLNIAPCTHILLENGQAFRKNPSNRNLIVLYGASTRSIPAQTTPYEIIVMC